MNTIVNWSRMKTILHLDFFLLYIQRLTHQAFQLLEQPYKISWTGAMLSDRFFWLMIVSRNPPVLLVYTRNRVHQTKTKKAARRRRNTEIDNPYYLPTYLPTYVVCCHIAYLSQKQDRGGLVCPPKLLWCLLTGIHACTVNRFNIDPRMVKSYPFSGYQFEVYYETMFSATQILISKLQITKTYNRRWGLFVELE